jgi:hypothetical protein
MKIIISESQYKTLMRRYVSPAPIDEMVDLFLGFIEPKKFPNGNTFYTAVLSQIQSRILRDMLEKNVISVDDLGEKKLIKNINNDVSDYIFLNYFDKIYDYYSEHKNK